MDTFETDRGTDAMRFFEERGVAFDSLEAQVALAPEVEFPGHLHGRIMRSVFIAGYGKYLAASVGVLVVNVGVLGVDLYRSLASVNAAKELDALARGFSLSPEYLANAASVLYSILPIQSIIVAALTVAFSTYVGLVFARGYRGNAAKATILP